MRYLLLFVLLISIGCENHSFDSDKRQLIAKDQIRRQLHKARLFDVTGFKKDTLDSYTDTSIKKPLRYQLDFVFTDSSGQVQNKKGEVVFTPDGKSVLHTRIN